MKGDGGEWREGGMEGGKPGNQPLVVNMQQLNIILDTHCHAVAIRQRSWRQFFCAYK